MGWEVIGVIGLGNIEVKDTDKTDDEKCKKTMEKVAKILKKNDCRNIEVGENQAYITFECSGNKGIDYDFMKEIKKVMSGMKYEISVCEYAESDIGFFFDSEEQE